MFNKKMILSQSEIYDSFYLYDENAIAESAERLKRDFKGVDFLYSIKTNSYPAIVKCILSQGLGADAASAAEVMLGVQNGVSKDRIQFSAPGKTKKDIDSTIDVSTIIADSFGELHLIRQLARERGITAKIGIRVNPSFSFFGGAGTPSKFGIDEELLFEFIPKLKEMPEIEVAGLHVHLRSQELSAAVLEKYYENLFILAGKFQAAYERPLSFLNMGSGIGIPYAPEDTPLDTASLGTAAAKLIRRFSSQFPLMKVYIETGRYVVGKSGVYVTKVLDKKVSHGKTFVILKNTLNGFIRPSLAQLITSYAGDQPLFASEPLFTGPNAFEFAVLSSETKTETVTLAGNLCTATDVVAKDVELPKMQPGDIVVMTNAGSYAAVLSPMQFSSQEAPAQLMLTRDGEVVHADIAR
ncbi:L-glutamyl-[BtrI acyl-carrier protein] decarboxylase [bioreactor metagenome]|uniref:L-glutamyl-[BtrI acyl-carrier protein] decarboxylase n=1 Tax=bioreactor metagenome TaxID=1076179 RepID=A0A644XFJ1_9ZZZZ